VAQVFKSFLIKRFGQDVNDLVFSCDYLMSMFSFFM
jgi:hypothetical protein